MAYVPNSLRKWFKLHFIADLLFGIPLLIAPQWTGAMLGYPTIDPLTGRLVGAALLGIGITSYLMHKKGSEVYHSMLTLKVIWSLAAIIGISLTIIEGAPKITWAILGIFIFFNLVWVYYKKGLN